MQSARTAPSQGIWWRRLTGGPRLAQGIVGSIPWNALVFFTLWLQLLGFTDFVASLLMAVFAGGCALGQLLGGMLGAQRPDQRSGFRALGYGLLHLEFIQDFKP